MGHTAPDEMKSLILLVALVFNAAAVQDLSGKILTFSETQYRSTAVKMTLTQEQLSALTVCHRSFTDLKRWHSLFSLTTPTDTDAFKIDYDTGPSIQLRVRVRGVSAGYPNVDYAPNKWHSICVTWNSISGVVQLWLDGQALTRKYTRELPITGPPIVVLGQNPSKHGEAFITPDFFAGMMSDVHMWDYVLSPCEIQSYMKDLSYTPGNIINWRALDFQITGRVLIEDKQICTML